MSKNVKELLEAALALPEAERLQFVSALFAAVEESGLRPFDDDWLEEIRRRSNQFDLGTVQAIPWSEVKAQVAQRVANGG